MNNIEMAYFVEAVICAYLLMYVMIKYGEQQRANKVDPDPSWLQASRKTAFFSAALLMLSSAVAYRMWVISIPVLVLLFAIIAILAFNALSQHRRTPPSDRGRGIEDLPPWPSGSLSTQYGHYISRADMELLRAEILRLDEGQMLTHKFLQAIHNELEIKPEPATIDPNPVVIHTDKFRPRKTEGQ